MTVKKPEKKKKNHIYSHIYTLTQTNKTTFLVMFIEDTNICNERFWKKKWKSKSECPGELLSSTLTMRRETRSDLDLNARDGPEADCLHECYIHGKKEL